MADGASKRVLIMFHIQIIHPLNVLEEVFDLCIIELVRMNLEPSNNLPG